eukprot:4606764-Amphidinium_carterae.1
MLPLQREWEKALQAFLFLKGKLTSVGNRKTNIAARNSVVFRNSLLRKTSEQLRQIVECSIQSKTIHTGSKLGSVWRSVSVSRHSLVSDSDSQFSAAKVDD